MGIKILFYTMWLKTDPHYFSHINLGPNKVYIKYTDMLKYVGHQL